MTRTGYVRRLATATLALALVGCAAPRPPLYAWGDFPRRQYDMLLHEGGTPSEQIQAMQAEAEKAKAGNAALPPGFRAHLGMLQLSVGNADAARDLWLAEKAAFPESTTYIDSLLKRLDAPAKTASKENSA